MDSRALQQGDKTWRGNQPLTLSSWSLFYFHSLSLQIFLFLLVELCLNGGLLLFFLFFLKLLRSLSSFHGNHLADHPAERSRRAGFSEGCLCVPSHSHGGTTALFVEICRDYVGGCELGCITQAVPFHLDITWGHISIANR